MAPFDSPVTHIAKCTVFPAHPSLPEKYKLTVSDLPMLSCQYIQKGVLFTRPPFPTDTLLGLLKRGLSQTLIHFPALAGRLCTDSGGVIYIHCNDSGVDFHYANAGRLTLTDVLSPVYVPETVKDFFALDGAVSYGGHTKPLASVQVTELADGVFIGCTVNHAVTDGTSFWNFFNTWAEICRGVETISRAPDFCRIFVKDSPAVLKFPEGGPSTSFSPGNLRERIFHFKREAILELKARANNKNHRFEKDSLIAEILGKQSNDDSIFRQPKENGTVKKALENGVNWLRNAVSKPLEIETSAQETPKRNVKSKTFPNGDVWKPSDLETSEIETSVRKLNVNSESFRNGDALKPSEFETSAPEIPNGHNLTRNERSENFRNSDIETGAKVSRPTKSKTSAQEMPNGANLLQKAKPKTFQPPNGANLLQKATPETFRNVVGISGKVTGFPDEISSFQSLCAHIWRSVTRARKLSPAARTTFRMAINCRHRLSPQLPAMYFGNAIQSIPSEITTGELMGPNGFRQCAQLLHSKVVGHGDRTVRAGVEAWERDPKCFPLGNFDGASITMGSSPRFPMYDNDFGWGKPLVVRSGRSNKFDGKFSAFPGREGGGSVDVEVCLAPETMEQLVSDEEFMKFVTVV